MVSGSLERPAATESERAPAKLKGAFSFLLGHVHDIGNSDNTDIQRETGFLESALNQNLSYDPTREAVILDSIMSICDPNIDQNRNYRSKGKNESPAFPALEAQDIATKHTGLTVMEQNLLEETRLLRNMYLASGKYLLFLINDGKHQLPNSFSDEKKQENGNGNGDENEDENEKGKPLSSPDTRQSLRFESLRFESLPEPMDSESSPRLFKKTTTESTAASEISSDEESGSAALNKDEEARAGAETGADALRDENIVDKSQDEDISIRAFALLRGKISNLGSPKQPSSPEIPGAEPLASDHDDLNEQEKSKVDDLQCHVCFKVSVDRKALKRHLKTHSKDEIYECPICEKKLSSPASLSLHKKKHLGERPFECSTCHKVFSTKLNLRYHVQIHKRARALRRAR